MTKIKEEAAVLIPTSATNKYHEESATTSKSGGKSYVDQIDKIKTMYIDDVSDLIGVPRGLILGDKADNEKNYNLFVETVIESLQGTIIGELNKMLTPKEFKEGLKYSASSVRYRDIFDLSTKFDKLISSGAFTRNELRVETGYEPIPGGDEFLITKNYEKYGERSKENA
ncbi:hypothetical protein AAFF39_00485 [Lactococcus garvieae]